LVAEVELERESSFACASIATSWNKGDKGLGEDREGVVGGIAVGGDTGDREDNRCIHRKGRTARVRRDNRLPDRALRHGHLFSIPLSTFLFVVGILDANNICDIGGLDILAIFVVVVSPRKIDELAVKSTIISMFENL
jgi:hypothetical protein